MSIRYSRADFDEFFQLVVPCWPTLTNHVTSTVDGSTLECHVVVCLSRWLDASLDPAWRHIHW